MLSLLQQSSNISQVGQDSSCENTKKTEMEWTCLLNCAQSTPQQPRMKNDNVMTLHSDKKFEKDSQGMWVWYKNQVLPSLKIKLIPNNFKSIIMEDVVDKSFLETFVSIQCFAIFSNNQILEVKLEGTTLVKFSKEKVADLRSIRLTETINSLNCRYFLFTLTAFQALDGEEQTMFTQLEQRILRSNQTDEIRLRALKNTLISQCISIQTRKKSLHQRVSLLCQLHPFVPNEFNRLLQMLHGENPEEILSADIRGLYFYFSNKKIRHKIFHPFYLAARFHRSIVLYYNDEGNTSSTDLSEVFLKIQKEVEQTLLSDQNNDDDNSPAAAVSASQKKKNQKNFDAKLAMQIISKNNNNNNNNEIQNQKQSKTQNNEHFRSKVLNYLMPLQSNAIKIIDEDEVIPAHYKRINYEEIEYQLAYTRVFPQILNTLFEFQEKRALYPSYLTSAGYSSQKEETSDFIKDGCNNKNKSTIKYKSTLIHKYDEKLRNKLLKVAVHSENSQQHHMLNIKNRGVMSKDQIMLNLSPIAMMNNNNNNNNTMQNNCDDQSKNALMNAMMMNICNNMQETNRKSYASNASETVGINQQNTNILEAKHQTKLNQQQGCCDDNHSQMSDDTHAQQDDNNQLNCFTPGDNKIKIRKLNSSINRNIPIINNNNNFTLIQENKNTGNVSDFKDLDMLAQNGQTNNFYKMNEASLFNNAMQPIDLQNYQQLLFSQFQQQNSTNNMNNVGTVQQLSNSQPSQQQSLILPQNLQQIASQNIQFFPQQQQLQILQQQQQQKQQLLVAALQQNNKNSNNNLQSLLIQNQFNKLSQSNNTNQINSLLSENALFQVAGQQNQAINNASLSLLSNGQTLQSLAVMQQSQQNFQQQQQQQQQQDLLDFMQYNQLQQQHPIPRQQQQQVDQMINLQQNMQQQNNSNNNNLPFQLQQIMGDQFKIQQQTYLNSLINQATPSINYTEVSRKSLPQQPQQNQLISLNLKQQQLLQQQQQQQQQTNFLQQQLSLNNNNNGNQFENQRVVGDLYQQIKMQQYQ